MPTPRVAAFQEFLSGVIPPDSHAPEALPPPALTEAPGAGHKHKNFFQKVGSKIGKLFKRKKRH